MPISRAILVLAALTVLAACQTTPTSSVDRADRIVGMFVEHCLDYAGRDQLRLEDLARKSDRRDGVRDISDQVKSEGSFGFPARTFLLEGEELLRIQGPGAKICSAIAIDSPIPSLESVIAAFQNQVGGTFGGKPQGGKVTVYNVDDHKTMVTGAETSVRASVGFGELDSGVIITLSISGFKS